MTRKLHAWAAFMDNYTQSSQELLNRNCMQSVSITISKTNAEKINVRMNHGYKQMYVEAKNATSRAKPEMGSNSTYTKTKVTMQAYLGRLGPPR